MRKQAKRRFFAFCLCCFFCLTLGGRTEADDATLQRFKQEAPQAWREVIQSYDRTSFSFMKQVQGNTALPATVCVQEGDNIRTDTIAKIDGKKILGVRMANEHYAAVAGDATGTGQVILMGAEPRIPPDTRVFSNSIVNFKHVRPSLTVGGFYLPSSFVDIGDFPSRLSMGLKVRDAVSDIGTDGSEIVRLKIELVEMNESGVFVPKAFEDGVANIQELTLSPNRNWCATRISGTVRSGRGDKIMKGTQIEQLGFQSNGFHPTSKRVAYKFEGVVTESIFEYSEISKIEVADNFFHVTSLGIPELDKFMPKPRYWLWALIVIGVVVMIAGLYVGRLRNHMGSKNHEP
jgi:hypothetical protein